MIIQRAFRKQVNSRYRTEPIDLPKTKRAKEIYDGILSRLLAMHDRGDCLLIANGCACCENFNPNSDITELEPPDLTT